MMSSSISYKLWGGCFEEEPSSVLRRLNDSLPIDSRLYREDIKGSQEWARELHTSAHLNKDDYEAIQLGLKQVEEDIAEELSKHGRLTDPEEDIHSVVERRLQAKAGDAALKLHTARSRNDQSATDTRLWMLEAVDKTLSAIASLIRTIVDRAEKEIDIIMPGYTHLQRAQPVRWSHFLMSHVCSLKDDFYRFKEQLERISRCPLGSGAIAGCAMPIDRQRLARNLGFEDITMNSMHAVSTRDHIVEFLNTSSLCGIHLSRLAEDLIIYSSQEFGFIIFSDQFSTGSSLMPQKRNPDGLELVRGTAGLLMGDALSMCCILKGLPSTYNKDLQSDKMLLFRSFDKLLECLNVTKGSVATMKINGEKAMSLLEPSMLATDLAHAMVRQEVPFRKAHHLVGVALKRAVTLGVDFKGLSQEEYVAICPELREVDVKSLFSWEASVEQYKSTGGTARNAVEEQINAIKEWLLK